MTRRHLLHCMPYLFHIPPAYQQHSNGRKMNNNENNRGGQRRRPNNYQSGGRDCGYRGDRRNASNTKNAFSNTLKQHMNVLYCFFCGYSVEHDGYNCHPSYQKQIHLPNVKNDDSHMYEGTCMRVQHKTLPDGTGTGQGYIMTKQMEKGRFVPEKQAARKAQQ